MFGKIQAWFPERGYGFIRPSENRKGLDSNLFFHRLKLPFQYQRDGSKLKLGMAVEFGLGQRKGNTIAIEVRPLIDDSAPQTGAVHVGQYLSKTFTEARQFMSLPNWVIDKIIGDKTIHGSVVRVLLYLFRETVGWNDPVKNISLKNIQNGAGVSRERAIHAVLVICECWGLFTRIRDQKDGTSSTYRIVGYPFKNPRESMEETFHWRSMVLTEVYGTVCPTVRQMKVLAPGCTEHAV